MTPPLTPESAWNLVLWGALLVGVLLGAVAQATRFCTMGALADWFGYGGTARLMAWMLAVAVAATGTLVLVDTGWLDATQTNAWSPRLLWLSNLVGGLVFGVGMVLASGCPQRNLVKAGAGSLKAVVTLLVAALAAQMTLRGVFSELRVRLLDGAGITLAYPQDWGSVLSHWAGGSAGTLRWLVLALCLAAVLVLVFRNRHQMEPSHWWGAVAVGLLVPVAWVLTGHLGFVPEHPDTLEPTWVGTWSHRPEALSFAAPAAHTLDLLTLWTDRNTVLTWGVVVSLGTVAGSMVLALIRKEFRLESFNNASDMGNHLVGGVLMGFGGITAMGCSIGQGITGLSLQSVGACLAVGGMVAGAWLALRFQSWRLKVD